MTLRIPVEQLSRAFGALDIGPADRPPMLRALANVGERYIARPFRRGTDPFGTPWAPLARAYDQRGRSGGQLVKSGALRRSMAGSSIVGDSVTFGRESPDYASYHQFGTDTIPRRQFVPENTLPLQWELDTREALDDVVARRNR